jgi:hypothetical protein
MDVFHHHIPPFFILTRELAVISELALQGRLMHAVCVAVTVPHAHSLYINGKLLQCLCALYRVEEVRKKERQTFIKLPPPWLHL